MWAYVAAYGKRALIRIHDQPPLIDKSSSTLFNEEKEYLIIIIWTTADFLKRDGNWEIKLKNSEISYQN